MDTTLAQSEFFEDGIATFTKKIFQRIRTRLNIIYSKNFDNEYIQPVFFDKIFAVKNILENNKVPNWWKAYSSAILTETKDLHDKFQREINGHPDESRDQFSIFRSKWSRKDGADKTVSKDKELASVNLTKSQIMTHLVLLSFSLHDSYLQNSQKYKNTASDNLILLQVLYQYLEIKDEIYNFIENFVLKLPELVSSKTEKDENENQLYISFLKCLEEILITLKLEEKYASHLKYLKQKGCNEGNEKENEKENRTFKQLFSKDIPHNRGRLTSTDKNEASLEKNSEKKETKGKNYTLDKYFQPDSKLNFKNTTTKPREKSSEKVKKVERKLDFENTEFIRSSFPSHGTLNVRTHISIPTFGEDSPLKKNLSFEIQGDHSNLAPLGENSKMSIDSSIKRPYRNHFSSSGNGGLSHILYSGRSTNYSRMSSVVSQFSFNPVSTIKKETVNSHSNICDAQDYSNLSSSYNGSNSLISFNFINSSHSVKMRGGINSCLFSKASAKTERRTRGYDFFKLRHSSGKKKEFKDSNIFLQKFFSKLNGDRKDEKLKPKVVSMIDDKNALKKLVQTQFYKKKEEVSPQSPQKEETTEIPPEYRDSAPKKDEKDEEKEEKTEQDIEVCIENTTAQSKLLSQKTKREESQSPVIKTKKGRIKNLQESNSKKSNRVSRNCLKHPSKRNEILASNSSTGYKLKSQRKEAEEEILVRQTPIKLESNNSTSPGYTTRKNLLKLFQQVNKSG